MLDIFKRFSDPIPSIFVEENKPSYLDEAPKKKYGRTRKNDKVALKNEVIAYLKEREGKVTQQADIAEAVGVTGGYVTSILKEMIKSGTISRRGKRGHYKFKVNKSRANKPRKAKKVDSVTVTRRPYSTTNDSVEAVFRYIQRHENDPVSLQTISESTGISRGSISYYIGKLVDSGRVVKSLPGSDGTRYWLAESLSDGPKDPAPKETKVEASVSGNQVASALEGHIWAFMKETKSTNVLLFLEWLQTYKEE